MNVGEKIKALRKAKKMSQDELADKSGVSRSAIAGYEAEATFPRKKFITKLAKALNVTEADLFTPSGQGLSTVLENNKAIKRIPVISWVHANTFEEICDPFPVGQSDDHIVTTHSGDNIFALYVVNDCMFPVFIEGDIIIVDPRKQAESGDFAVIADRTNNMATLKQYRKYDGIVVLHPLNPKYQDIIIKESEGDRYHIIGKVIAKETLFK